MPQLREFHYLLFFFPPFLVFIEQDIQRAALIKLTPSPSPPVIRGSKMEHSIRLEEYDRNYPKLSQHQN